MARPIDYKRQCKQLENKITRLEKAGRDIEKEMVQRGKEITNMIHIFLANEQDWPEEQRDEFRRVAVGYACRCDKDKDLRNRGAIEFAEARQGDYIN